MSIDRPTSDPAPSRPPSGWLAGGGAMGELVRARDWSSTPLGPIEAWPQSLRTALRIALSSRYPMFLWWGPELVNLYNDAYVSVLGDRHPGALGRSAREIWSDVWDVVGPQAESVLREGRASWNESVLLVMERYGAPEETYFTFSYSPLPDDSGDVDGVFCACTEDTQRVLGERRLRSLRELGARSLAETQSVEQVCRSAARTFADNAHDFPFALIYLLDEDGHTVRLRGSAGLEPGEPASPLTLTLGDEDDVWKLGRAAAAGEGVLLDGLDARLGALPGGPWPERESRQAFVLPLRRPAQPELPAGFLVCGVSPLLTFEAGYQSFLELAAGQLATGLSAARAHEEERRRAETLAELDRAKTVFFSNVSHEFRTPLTLMLGPIEDLLARGDALDAQTREQLTVAQRNALRMLKLVNSLLDFSRIEAGRALAAYEATDLATLTADLASHFRAACEQAGLELRVDCPPLREPVWVDREMWEKIVLNLLSNAFKFTLEGRIEVALGARAGEVFLTVRDTGVGIAAAELPRLFERFHRVEGSRGRTHEGSGIGLALVQELVKLHGGRVEVESEPGRGTTFTVATPRGSAHLPQELVGATRAESSSATAPAAFVEEARRWLPEVEEEPPLPLATEAASESAGRILLADDNADMRDHVRRLLSPPYEVTAAADGGAALELALAAPPDLVVADVMMPRMDGFELVRALRADPSTRHVPILLLSARAGEDARVEGLGAGADDYLTKPFSPRELLARVETHLRMSRSRRESEERFRALADSAPAILWITDEEDGTTYLSSGWYEFTGQDRATSSGRSWLEAVHPEDREQASRVFVSSSGRREPFALEYRLLRADGVWRWVLDAGRPRFDEAGRWRGYIGSVVDVHEHRQAEEALMEADRRKDEFLATLAHELRNPLAPIRAGLQVLRMALDDPQAVEQSLAIMERQSAQLTRLIDDLLDISRITRGKLQVRKQDVLLADVVQCALESARPFLDAAGHELELDLPAVPVRLRADLTRLAQVFANLLSNSAKYTPRGGRVRLCARRAGGEVLVTVTDTGIGIPREQLGRVFDMFTQIERPEAAYTGLGVGLTLVRSLVEIHGGRVSVDSAGPGLGSEFTVRLPCAAEPAPAAPAVAPAVSSPGPARRVLVVDDNEDAARLLALTVGLLGHEVRTVHDGQAAVELARAFRPEVVLMDLGMPRMSGYEAARRIRALAGGEELTLVAVTGWGQESDKRRTREAGFDHHLVKPAETEALEEILRGVGSSG